MPNDSHTMTTNRSQGMISTRTHGLIDYSVALTLGGLAASGLFPRKVSRLLGVAGFFHAGYSAITDYEAGFTAKIGMREHLQLDTAGALVLGFAGLTMRRQPGWARSFLIGSALAELAAVSLSSAEPESGPGQGLGPIDRSLGGPTGPEQIGYPPLDTPKPVADDVYIVDSTMPGPVGSIMPVRMTVIRLPNGDLLLHSPTPFSYKLKQALEEIGPIRHLVAPSTVHWLFVKDWQRSCPEATTWGSPELRQRRQVRKSGLRIDRDIYDGAPAEWQGALTVTTIKAGLGFREIAFFHQVTSTLVLTDMVLNLEEPKVPPLMRPLLRAFGSLAPSAMPPPYVRAIVRMQRDMAASAAHSLLARQPQRVIFAHGLWFDTDGTQRLRHAWRWLLQPNQAAIA